MVLDTVQEVIEKKQGYEVGDYKLIFKNTYDDEDNGKPKKYTINASHRQAPDVFYYVHIDVDWGKKSDSDSTTITNFESENENAASSSETSQNNSTVAVETSEESENQIIDSTVPVLEKSEQPKNKRFRTQ